MPEIATELGVRGLVEGTVMREGDEVRINVTLYDGPNEQQLWTDGYSNTITSVLKLQAEVALAIGEADFVMEFALDFRNFLPFDLNII